MRFVSLQGEWDDLVEVVDHVRIPAGTKPGRYVLGWRWCANTNADNDQPSSSSSSHLFFWGGYYCPILMKED